MPLYPQFQINSMNRPGNFAPAFGAGAAGPASQPMTNNGLPQVQQRQQQAPTFPAPSMLPQQQAQMRAPPQVPGPQMQGPMPSPGLPPPPGANPLMQAPQQMQQRPQAQQRQVGGPLSSQNAATVVKALNTTAMSRQKPQGQF